MVKKEKKEGYNLLHVFDDAGNEIMSQIPQYARFSGGFVNFKTEIFGKMKSCIPEFNFENQVEQLLKYQTGNITDYWEYREYFYRGDKPDLVKSFFERTLEISIYSESDFEKVEEIILYFLKSLPYYYELLGEDFFTQCLLSLLEVQFQDEFYIFAILPFLLKICKIIGTNFKIQKKILRQINHKVL